jgi:hypothetical protein
MPGTRQYAARVDAGAISGHVRAERGEPRGLIIYPGISRDRSRLNHGREKASAPTTWGPMTPAASPRTESPSHEPSSPIGRIPGALLWRRESFYSKGYIYIFMRRLHKANFLFIIHPHTVIPCHLM